MANEPLDFKPVNDGLGFHSFSDGLPYAPISKRITAPLAGRNAPAGAQMAGPPQFVKPTPTPPQFKAPPLAPRVAPPVPPVQPEPSLPAPPLGFFYLFKRVVAFTFDGLFNTCLVSAAGVAALWTFNTAVPQTLSGDFVALLGLMFLFLHWLLMAIQEVLFKTTVGKKLMGLHLEGSPLTLLLRAVAFPVGVVFFGLGILWPLFDAKRRGWHDIALKSQPLPTARS